MWALAKADGRARDAARHLARTTGMEDKQRLYHQFVGNFVIGAFDDARASLEALDTEYPGVALIVRRSLAAKGFTL